MKKSLILTTILSIVSVAVIFIYSCRKTEPKVNFGGKTCDCCNSFGGKTIKIINGDTLIYYSAFTPNNFAICDSNVYEHFGNSDSIISFKKCKPNLDSIYNDNVNNTYLFTGLEQFEGNDLMIKTVDDSTILEHFINYQLLNVNYYYNEQIFTGDHVDTTIYGALGQRQLESGKYQFTLQLYNSRRVHDKTTRIDSITGYFCIIRNKDFVNKGCEGKDPYDPLIKE